MTLATAASVPVAALAVLASGCGGASHAPAVASIARTSSAHGSTAPAYSAPTNADKEDASRCMRRHGVPNFPDPITIGGKQYFGFYVHNGYAQGLNGTRMDTNSPQYKAAYRFCGDRFLGLGHRPGLTPAAEATARAAALKYSTCMRSHGARDYPDPDQTGAINLPRYGYSDTPKVQRAAAACKSLSGKGFVTVEPLR
jgi:hypothetical protein